MSHIIRNLPAEMANYERGLLQTNKRLSDLGSMLSTDMNKKIQQAIYFNPIVTTEFCYALVHAKPVVQKQILGEHLYRIVDMIHPEYASKITGMFLEMDINEIIHLLETPPVLYSKMNEAIALLQENNYISTQKKREIVVAATATATATAAADAADSNNYDVNFHLYFLKSEMIKNEKGDRNYRYKYHCKRCNSEFIGTNSHAKIHLTGKSSDGPYYVKKCSNPEPMFQNLSYKQINLFKQK
jgi:hypothetical protein